MTNSVADATYCDTNKVKNRRGKVVIPAFFLLYLILPEYFALEISESLPLLTASRFLILALLFYCVIISGAKLKRYNLHGVGICFLLLILINVIHFYDAFSSSVKEIFSLLFEGLLVIWLCLTLLDTKEKVVKAVKWMVYGSAVIGIFAIVESFSGVNVFYYLTTTSRDVLQSEYSRLGLTRASGPFGHAVYLANYCVFMLPFSLYMFESKNQKRYLLIAVLNIVTCVLSESRGQILIMAVIIVLMFISKSRILKHRYIRYALLMVPVIALAFILFPSVFEAFLNIIKSCLSALGFDVSLSADFGENASGSNSRFMQFSGIVYLFRENAFVFGFGANAHTRGMVKYYFSQYSAWMTSETFDVGYVAYAMQYGLVGLFVYIFLFVSQLLRAKRLSNKRDPSDMNGAFMWFFVGVLLCLMTATVSMNIVTLVLGIMAAFNRLRKRDAASARASEPLPLQKRYGAL